MFDAFYRSGALVFGGGHVVLPLLRAEVVAPGWVGDATVPDRLWVAQAMPGPLFTFAAYLGAVMGPAPSGVAGAAIALVAIFLPGLLLLYGMLPFWDGLRGRPGAQAAMRGANASVVGILGAALYSPVWTGAVLSPLDFLLAVAGFLMLTVWKLPPWLWWWVWRRAEWPHRLASGDERGSCSIPPACCGMWRRRLSDTPAGDARSGGHDRVPADEAKLAFAHQAQASHPDFRLGHHRRACANVGLLPARPPSICRQPRSTRLACRSV